MYSVQSKEEESKMKDEGGKVEKDNRVKVQNSSYASTR